VSAELFGLALRAQMPDQVTKLALLCLVDGCRDDEGRLFPSEEAIARTAQCDEGQARGLLEHLNRVGLIRPVDLTGDEYRLDVDLFRRIVAEGWASVFGSGARP